MHRRFIPVALASLLLVGVLGISPLPAQESIEDARTRQEEIRREAAEVASEIDLLDAEDVDVARALADLEAFIAQTDADIDAALQAIAQAEADALAADDEADRLEGDIQAAREVVRQFAVSAYVSSDDSALDLLLSSDDPRVGELRRFFVDLAGGDADDAVGELRRLQDDQAALHDEADEARARAQASQAELETKRAELEEAVAAQEAVRADIQQRLEAWESESLALAAADAEVTQIILAEEERIEAAREEQIRLQAEAERQRQLEAQRLADEQRLLEEQQSQPDVPATDEGDTDETPTEVVLPPVEAPSGFAWPINGAVVSSFGWRVHPIFGTERFHSGIDINGSSGQPIAAAAAGVVITSGWMDGYGNTVIIDHGGGFASLYAHQSQLGVSVGQSVGQGAIIGYVGSTGWSTGPHLHFEIRISGSPVDPLGYL